jgi:hypothetical protein
MLSTLTHDRPTTRGSALCLLILAFLAQGGGRCHRPVQRRCEW